MKLRPSVIESAAICGFFALGLLLRVWHPEREAVEHFDEGVYSSVIWHDGLRGTPYPAREFYAPPLLPTAIEICSLLPGIGDYAPFAPAALSGLLTIVAMWLLARAWFGKAAGIFVAAIVALSDFHVIYSRMAMTDVPCLLWIIASVYCGTLAIQTHKFRWAAVSGLFCGLAWWTKYTGWLPLAILTSGTITWWIWVGRKQMGIIRVMLLLGTVAATAGLVFLPWWWHLQPFGGYAAVSANHVSYLGGFASWRDNLASQLSFQFWLDGSSGAFSLGLGMAAAAIYRWNAAGCSTWNRGIETADLRGLTKSTGSMFSRARILVRFLVASLALSAIALRIWTPLLLSCLALGGFGGMFLWPVVRRLWLRTVANDLTPTSEGSLPLSPTDLQSSASIDPALGLCTTLTWFTGMLLVTPFYYPYSRLFLPLLASIWLAAAAGVSWWLESNISVARRIAGTGEKTPPRTWSERFVGGMLFVAVASSVFAFNEDDELALISYSELFQTSLGQDRTSVVNAALKLSDECVRYARGDVHVPNKKSIPTNATIRPTVEPASTEPLPHRLPFTADERRKERLIVYVFGEPALCFHLANAGISAVPVGHLNLQNPDETTPDFPTFVVIGPNAKRTEGFWEMWLRRDGAFEPVAEVFYRPSDVTLLDLFSPKWLSQHEEAATQKFELHRVRSQAAEN